VCNPYRLWLFAEGLQNYCFLMHFCLLNDLKEFAFRPSFSSMIRKNSGSLILGIHSLRSPPDPLVHRPASSSVDRRVLLVVPTFPLRACSPFRRFKCEPIIIFGSRSSSMNATRSRNRSCRVLMILSIEGNSTCCRTWSFLIPVITNRSKQL
jgi:hypothetical protein